MEQDEKIKAYLQQNLSKYEQQLFEKQLADNLDLAIEVEKQRVEQKAVEQLIQQNLAEQLQSYGMLPQSKKIRFLNPKTIAIAASIALCIGFFAINIFNHSDSKLVATTLEEVAPIYERSIRSSASETARFEVEKVAILVERKAGEAAKAIDYFSGFEPNHPLYQQAQFNLAHAYLLDEQNEAAIQRFQSMMDATGFDLELKQASEYYQAIALLANGQTQAAQSSLEAMSESDTHLYQTYATQLLEELNSFWRKF
ncbi:MAG: hypothetical protein AAF806_20670 [Bacteroidota bacterium]